MTDSTGETLKHSLRVGALMVEAIGELCERSVQHDMSKTEDFERQTFDEFSPKLKDSTYGSDEYKGFLAAMKPALDHHYAANRHHPEHFPNGVGDMTLVDLIEMLADWKAAGERHANGSLTRSLRIQHDRFGLADQLTQILENTARHFGWLDDIGPQERPAGLPISNCKGLDERGRPRPRFAGQHQPHQFFDISSVSDLWCDGGDGSGGG